MIESYNNGLFVTATAYNNEQTYFVDRIGWETGMERDGYQGGVMILQRNIPGGGLGGVELPWYHHYNLPKNIATSKEGYQNKDKIILKLTKYLLIVIYLFQDNLPCHYH